jgi:hypothetical protein
MPWLTEAKAIAVGLEDYGAIAFLKQAITLRVEVCGVIGLA